MKTKLLLVCVFVLLFSACAAPGTPPPIVTNIPTEAIASTPEPTLPAVQTEPAPTSANLPTIQTYTDELAGFSLDYPAGWFIDASGAAYAEESYAYTIGIATWDLRNPPTPSNKNLDALPEGETKLDVTVVKQAMTLEEVSTQPSESGSPVLGRMDVTLAGGLPAIIMDAEGFVGGPTRTLVTILNGNVIYVIGFGNLENFEAIALTLRPN